MTAARLDDARTARLLFALTLVAGYGDAVAFFGFGAFTANMTGNTVLLAGALAARVFGPLPGAIGLLLPAASLVGFALGAAVAAVALRANPRSRRRTVALLIAMAAMIAAAVLQLRWPGSNAVLVALLSAVMGMQSVVAVHAGSGGISTTYVTGSIVRAIVNLLSTAAGDAIRAEGRASAATWAFYLVGAFAGAAALRALGPSALWVPAAVVALLAIVV